MAFIDEVVSSMTARSERQQRGSNVVQSTETPRPRSLHLRNLAPGDRFQPSGREGGIIRRRNRFLVLEIAGTRKHLRTGAVMLAREWPSRRRRQTVILSTKAGAKACCVGLDIAAERGAD